MNTPTRTLIITSGLFLLALQAGCASGPGQRIASAVAGGVAYYCAQPPLTRTALRETIALETHPNRIEVQCAADTPGALPAAETEQ